ncbi:MAG: replicative DNA helicase, partial [Candidatus Glassbacteria bacterium]|nr:replicative DNA helicase [Candidatus Glassbacteria bacterium]
METQISDRVQIELENMDRKVPFSQEAEISVLGGMLIDRDAISVAVETIDSKCFYLDAHRKLYNAIVSLYEKSVEIDPVTLADQLEKDGALEEVGGRSYILEVFGSVPTAANIAYHTRIVLEKYMVRRLIESCTGIIWEAYEPVEDVDKLIDSSEQRIFQIQDFRLKEGFSPVNPIIHEIINDLEKRSQQNITMTGVPSGFRDLDKITVGFQASDLVIVAGRPGMGKTSFCLNLALVLGCGTLREHPDPLPVAIFSLEMSKKQVVQRLLCSQARIPVTKMRTARLTDLEWNNLNNAANRLHDSPIFVDDTPEISVLELRAKARRLCKSENIGMVIVDYLQLMRAQGRQESRQQEISLISRSLKALAKELDLPVLALSQLSRAVEGRQDRRPQLADLRESGAIEQDA